MSNSLLGRQEPLNLAYFVRRKFQLRNFNIEDNHAWHFDGFHLHRNLGCDGVLADASIGSVNSNSDIISDVDFVPRSLQTITKMRKPAETPRLPFQASEGGCGEHIYLLLNFGNPVDDRRSLESTSPP